MEPKGRNAESGFKGHNKEWNSHAPARSRKILLPRYSEVKSKLERVKGKQ